MCGWRWSWRGIGSGWRNCGAGCENGWQSRRSWMGKDSRRMLKRRMPTCGSNSSVLRGDVRGGVADHALFHPTDGEQIDEGADDAGAEFVLRDAGEAGVVRDGDFDDFEAAHSYERREEAVHAFIKSEAFEALAFVDLEAAGG